MPGLPGMSGEEVLRVATDSAAELFGAGLDAVFALGSLAHGGFAPLVSDVDVALVLDRVDATTPDRIAEVAALTRARSVSPLAERLSVFWADWPGVRGGPGEHTRLPAVDRLDLLDSGRLRYGTDRRAGAVRPDGATLVREGAEFALDRLAATLPHDPEQLVGAGPRAVTKAVLFPVRFLYTLRTHRIGLNADAAGWYAEHGRHPAVVAGAMRWREAGIIDPAAVTGLLAAELAGLYAEFVEAYAAELPDLARPLRALLGP